MTMLNNSPNMMVVEGDPHFIQTTSVEGCAKRFNDKVVKKQLRCLLSVINTRFVLLFYILFSNTD